MTFARLNRGDWIAWIGALVLVVSLAVDWYGTAQGDEARRIERLVEPSGGPISGEVQRDAREDARHLAESEERNGLDPHGAIDALILVLLLAGAGLAFAAGVLRASGARFVPPRTPSAAAAAVAALLAALIAYRILQEPGLDAATTVKPGVLLALLAAAAVAVGAGRALAEEQAGTAWREPEPDPDPAAAADPQPPASTGNARAGAPPTRERGR